MYKVDYVDWKGTDRYFYICADSQTEAEETANFMQGVLKIKKVSEVRNGEN